MTDVLLNKVLSIIEKKANDDKLSAGYNGSYSQSADNLLNQIKWFKAGMNFIETGKVPAEWHEYEIQAKKETDPEYAEYMRLKAKFKNKI